VQQSARREGYGKEWRGQGNEWEAGPRSDAGDARCEGTIGAESAAQAGAGVCRSRQGGERPSRRSQGESRGLPYPCRMPRSASQRKAMGHAPPRSSIHRTRFVPRHRATWGRGTLPTTNLSAPLTRPASPSAPLKQMHNPPPTSFLRYALAREEAKLAAGKGSGASSADAHRALLKVNRAVPPCIPRIPRPRNHELLLLRC
jgi:hypothetical protein